MAKNSTYRKTYAISWEQLHRDAKALAWRLLDRGYFQGILAITRGGLVPAAIVARELDIHLVDTICISSYDWKDKKGEAEVLKKFHGDGEGWLLVDDLVDSGATLVEVIPVLKARQPQVREIRSAVIWRKGASVVAPDYFVESLQTNPWIHQPFEAYDHLRPDDLRGRCGG